MNLLDKISDFGAVDAENDERLIEYFFQSPILDDLYKYNKSIVIGRKGTGKTAIYKYIENDKKNNVTALLFKDYPWNTHDLYINTQVSERERYINSWVFFFYIEIFKNIIHNIDSINHKKTIRELKRIKKWIENNWGKLDFDHKEVLAPRKSKFRFSFSPQAFGFGLGSVSRALEDRENLGQTLSEFNRKLESILKQTLNHYDEEIILLFDQLDLPYSITDANYDNRLVGLFLAALSLFPKYNKQIRIYLFLRSDIFNVLRFQDKSKIKNNMVVNLDWDPINIDSPLSLKQLIANRIMVNIESLSSNFDVNWNELFDDENLGRQTKWNYITDRTFIRPRDFIKYLNLSLNAAKQRINNDSRTKDKITNRDILRVRIEYSNYLFEELVDEIFVTYPQFDTYLEILRNIHSMTFSTDEYLYSYELIAERYDIAESHYEVLEALYAFGIIGFYKPGGGGLGGSEYCFKYKSVLQPFSPAAERFRVHFGFKEYLELVDK